MDNIWAFLEQTLTATVAAVLLLVTKRLFLDKLSPRWQYGVWAILALRVLLPTGLLGRALLPGGQVVLEAAKAWVERGLSSALTDPYGITQVTAPIPLVRLVGPNSVTDLLFLLYAAGVAALLLWFGLAYLALRRRVARGGTPSPAVLDQLRRVAGQYGLNLPRRVVVLTEAESAFVCGPLSPVLVLPDRAVDDKVLLHELLHLKYGDLWAGVGMCVLRCLHWCNPVLWYCWNLAQNDCEALCDQRVLERLEGEDRRAYGVILLSMADHRYARAPGTTSMANGGRNIKARIGAIARFKRYPRGMALASGCVALVLAAACLVGTSGAAAVPAYDERGELALAKAQLNRPTTVAGALDTYAQAVLCDSPVYYAMVAPEGDRQQAQQQATQPFEEADLYSSPFWELGFTWSRPAWQAEWSVMNLMADGTGGYTGTLFFIPLNGHDTMGVVVQQVAVRPEGMFWTVERLGKLEPWVRDDLWLCPSSKAPYTTYVAEAAGLRVEVDFQCRLWVEHQKVQDEGMFQLYSGGVDFTPNPHGIFAEVCTGIGARVCSTETGDTLDLTLKAALMGETGDPAQALKESRYCFTLSTGGLDDDVVQVSTGTYSGDGMSLTAMPAALAVQFAYEGQTHTCVALPEEVRP